MTTAYFSAVAYPSRKTFFYGGQRVGITRVYAPDNTREKDGDRNLHTLSTVSVPLCARLLPTLEVDKKHMNTALKSIYAQYPQD